MAVDLADYIESLRREVTPLNTDPYAEVSEEAWLGYLADAFWEARLDGFLSSWECNADGVVTPTTGDTDIPRELVGLVVVYAGIRVIRNQLLNTNTRFAAKAGPVEYETENSANLLTELLKQLRDTKTRLLEQAHESTDTYYFDQFVARDYGHLAQLVN